MKIVLFYLFSCLSVTVSFAQRSHQVNSPDKRIRVTIEASTELSFTVQFRDEVLIPRGVLSMDVVGHPTFRTSVRVVDAKTRSVKEEIRPVLPEKRSVILDAYNELKLTCEDGFGVEFRAYDDAVAYRIISRLDGTVEVMDETVRWTFSPGDSIYFPQEDSFFSHNERLYSKLDVALIADSMFCSLPALVATTSGVKLFLSEADVSSYPAMYLKSGGLGTRSLVGIFPRYPLEETAKNDRDVVVAKEAPFIAKTSGTRSFPWRVIGIAEKDGDLILNDIVYRLGKPLALKNTEWIKPGKVAWDWWNATNIYGVPFRSGMNTATYQYFIDFASQYKIEYIIFDEGWSTAGDLTQVNPDMDLPALFAYAKLKNVGIIPWVLWNALEKDLDGALDRFEAWGAKGVKVDFMQRSDQRMVEYYERVAREAAKRHLLIDFHGAYKPDGLRRAYPNVLTREGVRGAEWNKWSPSITPTHNLTLPFIRMVAGPMDYTPGATINANAGDFKAVFSRPMSQGTRCHQLGMYVVYESPLQMLCDNPSNYLREPETMEFLSDVPTTWHETKVLEARVGEYLLVARRHGETWYIGGMTDWMPREFEVKLDFLKPGKWILTEWSDGVNADRFGNDFVKRVRELAGSDPVKIRMAAGGGWVGIVKRDQ